MTGRTPLAEAVRVAPTPLLPLAYTPARLSMVAARTGTLKVLSGTSAIEWVWPTSLRPDTVPVRPLTEVTTPLETSSSTQLAKTAGLLTFRMKDLPRSVRTQTSPTLAPFRASMALCEPTTKVSLMAITWSASSPWVMLAPITTRAPVGSPSGRRTKVLVSDAMPISPSSRNCCRVASGARQIFSLERAMVLVSHQKRRIAAQVRSLRLTVTSPVVTPRSGGSGRKSRLQSAPTEPCGA